MVETDDDPAGEAVEEIGTDGLGVAVMAALGSVALALYFYYVRGDRQRGQFVGLWPGTILALATFFKLEEIRKGIEELTE